MKNKLKVCLLLEAIIFVIYAVLFCEAFEEGVFHLLELPLKGIGIALRILSLSGTMGNIIAIILYLLVGLLPILVYGILDRKRKRGCEDFLLFIISFALFVIVYWYINPGKMPVITPISVEMRYMAVDSVFAGLLLAYLVCKAVKLLSAVTKDSVYTVLSGACVVIMVSVVFAMFGINMANLMHNLKMQSGNDLASGGELVITQINFVLKYLVQQISFVAYFLLAKTGFDMIPAMRKSLNNKAIIKGLEKIICICKSSLLTIVFAEIIVNMIQLFTGAYNLHADYHVTFPLSFIVMCAIIILIVKLIKENIMLKEENDLFI